MKRLTALLTAVFITLNIVAQPPVHSGGQSSSGRFYGKIVDETTEKGIEAASVQLFRSGNSDSLLAGMLTKKTGDFSLENLPARGKFRLSISAIGYKTIDKEIGFDFTPGDQMDPAELMAALDRDLGNIKLAIDMEMLASVVVSAQKPLMQMGIDRKIFNVDKNINSTGGTAVDVMRNIPAINVDIDGNVTMRNSSPQIFIDGRPTTLTLEQIPSDAIESVEMITNPSAKFDASGGQAGILNIVLKKQKKVGYNGGVRVGIDSRGRPNAGGDINIRQEKVNFFGNFFMNSRKSKTWSGTERTTFAEPVDLFTTQDNFGIGRNVFFFTRFGLDYFLDNRNTLSISQNIVGGHFKNDNQSDLSYQRTDGSNFESQYRNTLGQNKWRNYTTTLGFKHLFAEKGRELTADFNYNHGPSNGNNTIAIRSFNDAAQQNPKYPEQLQRIESGGKNIFLVGQVDYTHPINADMKWEAGLRTQARIYESFQFNYYNGIAQENLNNEFKFNDNVHAAYGTFSHKVKDIFNYQLGLRVESSKYEGEQIGKQSFENSFPLSFFPSIFFTKEIGNRQDLQLNYSRKINRPNFFQLMPNTDFSDTLNLQTGNPALKPEFTNSLELSYQKNYGERNNTFLATLFGKHTSGLIARYQTEQQFGDTSALVASYINASNAYAAGLELIFRNNLTSWWEMNLNTNLYYSKIDGSDVVEGLENERTSSFTKLNNTFKITPTLSVQFSGEYQSKSALPVSTGNSGGGRSWGGPPSSTTQGYIGANYSFDIGIRKDFKIKNNQASLSFNMRDIFRTKKQIIHSESHLFIQDEWRRRDPQVARLNFSYRFGKFDANLFKRKNSRSESDSMEPGME